MAIPEWAKLRNGEHVSLERALGAFDLFIPESQIGSLDKVRHHQVVRFSVWKGQYFVTLVLTVLQITAMLNDIATKLVTDYPNIDLLSPRAKALTVAAYLREKNLTGIEPDREYHDLRHNFLGIALKDTNHNSLPLISAAIFCFVAQSIGLNARPCGFPFHVHVIIMPARGVDMDGHALPNNSRGEPMYMDPFRSANETPVSELRSQLVFLGASGLEQTTFLGESLTPEIVLRCGKNILNSIEQMSHTRIFSSTTLDVVGAKYAGLWSLMLFTGPARPVGVRQYLPWLMELFLTDFPSDIHLIERYLLPLFRGFQEYEHLVENLHVMRAVDEIPKQVRHRTSEHKNVTYRIGQVFRHRRYNYRAIITGWDAECGAGEQWMREMDIDHLRAGRHQSFYHAL
jgi:F-box protein 21